MYADLDSSRDVRPPDGAVREALRFGLGTIALGVGFLFTAAVWVGTCSGATADSLACGAPQRTLLAPILFT